MSDSTNYPDLEELVPRLDAIQTLNAGELKTEEIALLGRKTGLLTIKAKSLGSLPVEERKTYGARVNELKVLADALITRRREELQASTSGAAAAIDLTMPGRQSGWARSIPSPASSMRSSRSFGPSGSPWPSGPEIETEWYNFLALNFPPDHPAMDMHDTFYVDAAAAEGERSGRLPMRTHTSPVQIRTAARLSAAGTCGHSGNCVPKRRLRRLALAGLQPDRRARRRRGNLVRRPQGDAHPLRPALLSPATRTRFRPSFFPFTEPSAEMDVECQLCHGSGCPACKGTGWMEILGCGMVHPAVLENCDLDPERFTGWAFGMGPHRITMLRYGLPDIRLLLEGDMRFLSQVGAPGGA